MSQRRDFDITCPNNHDQRVSFTEEEFEARLHAGALVFHCNTCDTDWEFSGRELEKFRKEFGR